MVFFDGLGSSCVTISSYCSRSPSAYAHLITVAQWHTMLAHSLRRGEYIGLGYIPHCLTHRALSFLDDR